MLTVRVYHAFYGCETGCCGHRIEVDSKDVAFEFIHPYGRDAKEWALEFARSTLATERPECLATIDWDSIDVSEVSDS